MIKIQTTDQGIGPTSLFPWLCGVDAIKRHLSQKNYMIDILQETRIVKAVNGFTYGRTLGRC